MKKQILILAGAAMVLASCGSNNNSNQNTQAQMDSISKANAAMQDELNKKKNDSTINAMAAAKADSIEKASHKETGHEAKGTGHKGGKGSTTSTPPASPAPTPTPTAQDNKFNNRQPGGDQSGNKLTPDQQKAQDDKFNRRGK